jgi:hypothetical protein
MHCVSTAQSFRGAFGKTQIFNLSSPNNYTLLSIVPRMLTIHVLQARTLRALPLSERSVRLGQTDRLCKHTSDAFGLSFPRYEPVKIVQVDGIDTKSAERLVKRLLYELWIRFDNSFVPFVMR